MLGLNEDLRKGLSKALVNRWLNADGKYYEIYEMVKKFGCGNTTTVLLEEPWMAVDKLGDQTFNDLIKEIAGDITLALFEEFKWAIMQPIDYACEGY